MRTSLTAVARSSALTSTRRGRLTLFFLLYLAEGLPLGLNIYALSAYFRIEGIGVADIGALSAALVAPWGLKVVWSPLVDLIRVRRFGPNRFWIVLTQTMMAATLAPLFFVEPSQGFGWIAALLVLHNVFAATQDIAIDGFAARILPEDELTWAHGLMFAGQNIGMAVGGGGSLFLAGRYGFKASFALVVVALLCILLTVSRRIREDKEEPSLQPAKRAPRWAALHNRLARFGRELYIGFFRSGRGPRVGALFCLLPGGAMALAFGIAGALQVDLGFTEEQISISTTTMLLAGAAGCGLAGALGDRIGLKRLLALGYALTAAPTACLGWVIHESGLGGVSFEQYLVYAVLYRFAFGICFGARGAICMAMTNPIVGATQFTAYNSLGNIAIAYSGYWQGMAASRWGYGATLGIDAAAGMAGVVLIPWLSQSKTRVRAMTRFDGTDSESEIAAGPEAAYEFDSAQTEPEGAAGRALQKPQ